MKSKDSRRKKIESVIVGTRISKILKEKMDKIIEKGLYINVSDLLRDIIRQKFKEEDEAR